MREGFREEAAGEYGVVEANRTVLRTTVIVSQRSKGRVMGEKFWIRQCGVF